MFRPIRMDHTNCLQVAIKTLQFLLASYTLGPRLVGELEHLKIETRLIDEMFASVMGEYVFVK
jgi:hypothetical protein